MDVLPRDVLLYVCNFLTGTDALAFLSVSRRLLALKPRVTFLRFKDARITKRLVECIAPFTGLRVLELHSIGLKGAHFDAIFGALPELQSLNVCACRSFHQAGPVPATVRHLLIDATRISPQWAANMAARLPQLLTLSLRGCHRLMGVGIASLLACQSELCALNIGGTAPSSWPSPAALLRDALHPRLTALQTLDIRLGTYLPGAAYAVLTTLPALVEVDATATLLDDGVIANMRAMRSLLLQQCPIGDASCAALAAHSTTTITRLGLLDCTRITSVGFASLAELTNLTDLALKAIPVASDALFALCAQLPRLRIVNLDKCDIADDAVMRYASQLAPLSVRAQIGRVVNCLSHRCVRARF